MPKTFRTLECPFTTLADGSKTVISAKSIVGVLHSIRLDVGTLAATADITVSDQEKTLLTITNGDTSKTYFVRSVSSSLAGVDQAGEVPLDVIGPITVAVAQGGNAMSGKITVRYID